MTNDEKANAVALSMQLVMGFVDKFFSDLVGERQHNIVLVVGAGDVEQYISNRDRAAGVATLQSLLARWNAGVPDRLPGEVSAGDLAPARHLLAELERCLNEDARGLPHLVGHWAASRDVRAILQCRDGFPKIAAVDVLFDASGGRGIVPDDWPYAVKSTFCGYAGGLKPENVAAAIDLIGFRAQRYWIDMESGVRDEQNRFSVEKCREVCEAVYGAPIGGDHG